MNWWVILLIAAFAALVIFLIAPVVFIFVAVFSRKETKPFEEYDWEKFKDHYYVPFLGRIEAARSFVRGHSVKRVSVMSYDGLKLSGDYYDLGCKRTAILFHGFNAEVYTNLSVHAELMMKLGFNVLLPVHRAHGRSEGRWSGIGLREQNDVLSWVNWAERHGSKQILLYGVSMGAAAVAYASDRLGSTNVSAVVLDSCYYSVYEQMKRDVEKLHIPRVVLPGQWVLAKLFLRIDIKSPTTNALKRASAPTLFIHGTGDETVYCQWGEKNYEACAAEKELLLIKDAPHTLSLLKDETKAGGKIAEFIHTYIA